MNTTPEASRFVVKPMTKRDRWSVMDTSTRIKIIFTIGDWNDSQKVITPHPLPDGLNVARTMREIGDYMAANHPELLWPTQEQREQLAREAEERERHFYDTVTDIGTAIGDLRQYHGLTVEEAAARAGVTVKKLENIEAGRFTADFNTLCRIIESLEGRLAIVPEETPDDPHCEFIEFEP